jgi:hypothetical protein
MEAICSFEVLEHSPGLQDVTTQKTILKRETEVRKETRRVCPGELHVTI